MQKEQAMVDSNKVRGGLWGLLVGDALGVPYEFNAPADLPALEHLEMVPPTSFMRSHQGVAPGTWSDDGALSLALLDSLLEQGSLDLNHFGSNVVAWARKGKFAVGGQVFDIGIQTSRAVSNLKRGMSAAESGPTLVESNGNGSLMRVLPLALWHQGDTSELVQMAHAQSLPTHGHPVSQVCCAVYVLVARNLLQGGAMAEAWEGAIQYLTAMYESHPEHAQALAAVLAERQKAPRGSGYVVDSLWSVFAVCKKESYEAVVKNAVALGRDTDTTACIAGGLAGIRFGYEAIPLRWRDALRGREILDPLEARLLDLR